MPKRIADVADALLEASVAGSFTRLGSAVRARLEGWEAAPRGALLGKRVVITGATSGLGLAMAQGALSLGAEVCFVARNRTKAERVAAELSQSAPGRVSWVLADMGDLGAVREAAKEIQRLGGAIHGLVHNAGALDAHYSTSPQGLEQTLASHLVGPFLLTGLLMDSLCAGAPSRVIWVASGGMYAEPLCVDALEMTATEYDGVLAYARAKRAQVCVSELQAERFRQRGVSVHAMHPGWADTAGVARGLPRFHRLLGPVLRSVEDGCDTALWLLWAEDERLGTGRFWHDRRARDPHRFRKTRRADTQTERRALWVWLSNVVEEYRRGE